MDYPHNSVKFGIWESAKPVTTSILCTGWKVPSPQTQCHRALWLNKNVLNFCGVLSRRRQILLIEVGDLVPAEGFGDWCSNALKTQKFLLWPRVLTFPPVSFLLLCHKTKYKSRRGQNLSSGLCNEMRPMAFHSLAQSLLLESKNNAHRCLCGSSKHKRCLWETAVWLMQAVLANNIKIPQREGKPVKSPVWLQGLGLVCLGSQLRHHCQGSASPTSGHLQAQSLQRRAVYPTR